MRYAAGCFARRSRKSRKTSSTWYAIAKVVGSLRCDIRPTGVRASPLAAVLCYAEPHVQCVAIEIASRRSSFCLGLFLCLERALLPSILRRAPGRWPAFHKHLGRRPPPSSPRTLPFRVRLHEVQLGITWARKVCPNGACGLCLGEYQLRAQISKARLHIGFGRLQSSKADQQVFEMATTLASQSGPQESPLAWTSDSSSTPNPHGGLTVDGDFRVVPARFASVGCSVVG